MPSGHEARGIVNEAWRELRGLQLRRAGWGSTAGLPVVAAAALAGSELLCGVGEEPLQLPAQWAGLHEVGPGDPRTAFRGMLIGRRAHVEENSALRFAPRRRVG